MAPLISPTSDVFYVGNTEVSKIYLGANVIYSPPTFDSDAAAYISAVESVDGQVLETEVKTAINNFVTGCKADGIWSAIQAAAFLAGPRTIAGCLRPLKGAAPVGYNLALSDLDRKLGIRGDGSTKYIDSSRNNNSDDRNSNHNAVWISEAHTLAAVGAVMGNGGNQTGANTILVSNGNATNKFRNRSAVTQSVGGNVPATGLIGCSRPNDMKLSTRLNGSTVLYTVYSNFTVLAGNVLLLRAPNENYSDARIAFYSIGSDIDLTKLSNQVSIYMSAIATAIP